MQYAVCLGLTGAVCRSAGSCALALICSTVLQAVVAQLCMQTGVVFPGVVMTPRSGNVPCAFYQAIS
jgi:hypothetical protein